MSFNNEKQKAVLILVVSLFITIAGLAAFKLINTRLLPNIQLPTIEVKTTWAGKSIDSIKKNITIPLEQQFSQVRNVKTLVSSVESGITLTTITFHPNTDMDAAYADIVSKVNQTPNWPVDAQKPMILNMSGGANAILAAFILHAEDSATPHDFIQVFKNDIQPELMAINGISNVGVTMQPIEERMNIIADTQKMRKLGVTFPDIINSIDGLEDISGGDINVGRKKHHMVFKGELSPDKMHEHIIKANGRNLVLLSDIATIEVALENQWVESKYNGRNSFYFFARPSDGADTLTTMQTIKDTVNEINARFSSQHDFKITMWLDDSIIINDSINFIKNSILLGLCFTALIIFIFLRDVRSALFVLLSVPFSLAILAGSMLIFGKEMHLISLAGISLSVGLIVDAAIIATESIHRHYTPSNVFQSIAKGMMSVRSTLISSTLTSVIIFVPLLLIQTKEGQLFEDLAFVITLSLLASLLYSIAILPALCQLFSASKAEYTDNKKVGRTTGIATKLTYLFKRKTVSLLTISGTLALCVYSTLFLRPDFDVLPNPISPDISVYVEFEEGMSEEAIKERVISPIIRKIEQSIASGTSPDFDYYNLRCLPRGCYLIFNNNKNIAMQTYENWIYDDIFGDFQDVYPYPYHASLLRSVLPDNRGIEVDFSGADIDTLIAAAKGVENFLGDTLEGALVYENSELYPRGIHVEFNHNKEKLAYNNVRVQDLNQHLAILTQGVYLGDILAHSNVLPLYIKSSNAHSIDDIKSSDFTLPNGNVVKIGQLTTTTVNPTSTIDMRVNSTDVASLYIEAPADASMGVFSNTLEALLHTYMTENGYEALKIQYRGSPEDIDTFIRDFSNVVIFSFLILFALVWYFTRSPLYSGVIMMSLPVSIAGGVAALHIFGLFANQNLDMITIIGFIILMGLVINNGILLVSSFIESNKKTDVSHLDAIIDAIDKRKRAIFISTLTSLFGMLPLLYQSTTSSEIYQGLAVVIIGGMISNVTLGIVLMVAMLALVGRKKNIRAK